jgi:hypothetical protein
MIEQLQNLPGNVLGFVCHGHVTKKDYETVLIPAVERALAGGGKVRLYYETAADFAGIESGAVLDDMKVGLSHWLRWERFAVVTDVDWIRHTMQFFSFLMPGEMKVFPRTEAAKAKAWIAE